MKNKIYKDKYISCKQPFVSCYTPTIRTGFWNIMAENLSRQTYKNFEWLIIDDYKEDRSKIAAKYAKKYDLNVRYLRGSKNDPEYKRRCALVRANNMAMDNMEGELLVFLQDFILMPEDGLERYVDLYNHNPNAILAGVDVYYNAKEMDKSNDEDWWNGKTDVLADKYWTNPRVQNQGIRSTENPFDFEANYGAIPKTVLDKLKGWWEFIDDGLGYDNTEFAWRAIQLRTKVLIDDTNIAQCINIWPVVAGTKENILERDRILNTPRYLWMTDQMRTGKLPLVRNPEIDKTISLQFEVPKELSDQEATQWINENADQIIAQWENEK